MRRAGCESSQPFSCTASSYANQSSWLPKHAIVSSATCASLHRSSVWAQSSRNNTVGQLETYVPTRAITRGPLFTGFGYYDKHEFDPSNRFVLANQVEFEGRFANRKRSYSSRYTSIWSKMIVGLRSAAVPHGAGSRAVCCNGPGKTGRQIMWNDRQAGALRLSLVRPRFRQAAHHRSPHLYAQRRWPSRLIIEL